MNTNGNLAHREKLREELIAGELVAMSPSPSFNHNHIASNIYRLFANYLDGKTCTAIADGTDLYLTEDDRYIPDVMIVCDREKIRWNGVHGAPDLVVEVLSPGTAHNDRSKKWKVYESCGVREYWLVDPANRTVEQYFLQEGRFELNAVHVSYLERDLESMTEDEKAELVVPSFRCSLYDGFDIQLSEIFKGLLP